MWWRLFEAWYNSASKACLGARAKSGKAEEVPDVARVASTMGVYMR